ncbi:hypothetical protein CYMTET_38180 [Cymbomonas tetramitiformis]|uniref:Uncharacterized protein n=1 Tax=Cymbomonas tetramitiformis TaxID=36881 RepID=A0AAE0CE13_9CHLO|nr:hypothetical protein CYMTET_38180 [Cymbomonas tetramitiformis]
MDCAEARRSHIQFSTDKLTEGKLQTHLVPCAIKSNGVAPISQYFRPEATDQVIDGKTVLHAALRGRELNGARLGVPDGYNGYVMRSSQPASSETTWTAESQFEELTYWLHDVVPTASDLLPRALEWAELAKEAHAPISAADVEAMME